MLIHLADHAGLLLSEQQAAIQHPARHRGDDPVGVVRALPHHDPSAASRHHSGDCRNSHVMLLRERQPG